MKIYKTEPNEYGWYYVVHKNKDGCMKFFKKCIDKERKEFENEFILWGEGIELLKKVMRDKHDNN